MKISNVFQKVFPSDSPQMRPVRARFIIIVFFTLMAVVCLPLLKMAHLLPTVMTILLVAFAGNLVSYVWILWGRGAQYRVYFATFVDIFLTTVVLHYLGGMESTLSWAYAIILIAIASIHGLKIGIYVALVSCVLYSSLLIGEFTGAIPHIDHYRINPAYIHDDPAYLYLLLISSNALFLIAATASGLFYERLLRGRNELRKSNEEILDMQGALREHMSGLERRVAERTLELTSANEQLLKEIEDRKSAEEGLRNSQERLSIMFEFAPDAYYLSDMEGRLLNGNRAAEEMIGYSRDELIGKSFIELDLLSADQIDKVARLLAENIEGRPTGPDEFVVNPKGGNQVTVEIRTYPVKIGNQSLVLVLARDITGRRRMEQALRMSEKRYRSIYDTAPLACVTWDRDCLVTDWNKRAEKVFGWSRDEVVGKNFFDFLIPEWAKPQVGDVVEVLLKGELPNHSVNENVTKSGEIILCEWNNSVRYDDDGDVAGAVSIALDITERRRAEEELRASEKKHRTLFDSLEIGFYETDLAGNLIFFNETVCRSLGYPREELLGMNYAEFVDEQDTRILVEAFTNVFKTGRTDKSFVCHAITKDGGRMPVEYSVSLVRDHDGIPIGFRGVARDVTESKRAEELIQQSEERYRALFEESRDVILMTTPEGRYIDINHAGVEFYGFSSKEELLENLDARDTYADPKEREEFQRIVAEHGFVKDYEVKLNVRGGKQQTVLMTANVVRDEAGEIVAYRETLRDITQERQLEQQFLQAQKMESIGTLAGGIAHDFNNILGGILGYASLMKSKIDDDHQFARYIDTIEKGAMRAAELTSQLLAFARGGKYDTRPVEMNNVIEETLGIIGRTFDKSIQIETRLQENLPDIEADPGQMQQALMNLCVNAADAMPEGGKLTIETFSETFSDEYVDANMGSKGGQYIIVSVSDTGVGMDEQTMQRIFEPFFTTKEEGKGTGLGLSMTYGVVNNHGGFVTVQSGPQEGTVFKVNLPARGEHESARPVEEAGPPHGENEMILVVDDEEPIRLFAKEVLESHGYRVLLAEDGAEALDVFHKYNGTIGLVILDMVMPKMGGQETFLKLKDLNPDIKALLSTGYSQNGKAQEILNTGVSGFIQKPYRISALLSKVRSVLDGGASG